MSESKKSDLVLNSDGSLYHINLSPGDLAETIILVGDPGRVKLVSSFFDDIELEKHNREVHTITGSYKGKRMSVVSTGMGTDNIEIVINEIDALFNIDLETKKVKPHNTSLNLIRIGTSGGLKSDIPVKESFLMSEYSIGLDGLAYFYKDESNIIDRNMTQYFIDYMNWDSDLPKPYAIKGSDYLLRTIGYDWRKGITLTAPGFYAPQGRELRLKLKDPTIIDRAQGFSYKNDSITNFEMETSALYFLSSMLGHNAITVCAIIANRITKEFDPDYKSSMQLLVKEVIVRLSKV